MKKQLIINILGDDQLGILSEISASVNDKCCNILDSRHAIYGKDFSLTMIVDGSTTAISKLELELSQLCVRHGLLSMMKRTSHHLKQNLNQLIHFEFKGVDAEGILREVTSFLSEKRVNISALRQKTYVDKSSREENLKCKMVLSAPEDINLSQFDAEIKTLMSALCLAGKITHHDLKEENEHIESW